MSKRDEAPRGTPEGETSAGAVRRAQIEAVLALDVEREDALIRERALEIARECAALAPDAAVPALAQEIAALVDAYEGYAGANGGGAPRVPVRAAEVGRASLALAARIAAR